MTTFLILQNTKTEVLDKTTFFEEGETIFLEEDGVKKSYKIGNIVKVLTKSGEMADVTLEVHLIG